VAAAGESPRALLGKILVKLMAGCRSARELPSGITNPGTVLEAAGAVFL
jgi:hypothetical protein